MAPPRKRITRVGELLRAVREAAKLDQQGLAARVFVSRRTVSRWENGRLPSSDEADRILDIAARTSPSLHAQLAPLLGFEVVSDPEPAPAPPAPAPPPPVVAPRPSTAELRAALDAVVYAVSEERDVLPRHLRAFGVELLQRIAKLGLTPEEAAELVAVRERAAKAKAPDATV